MEWASNADDAVESSAAPFESCSSTSNAGQAGARAYRDVRELAPNLPVVMVTKREEDCDSRRRSGQHPRLPGKADQSAQVLSIVTHILEARSYAQQASRADSGAFRAIELERDRNLDWRGWIEPFDDLDALGRRAAAAGETGLYDCCADVSGHSREFRRLHA